MRMTRTTFRVIVLDHHKTALEMLNTTESQHPNLDARLDMSRSGATIALDYFKPEVHRLKFLFPFLLNDLMHVMQISTDQRTIFDYIEDADLWKWKLPDNKAFHAGVFGIPCQVRAPVQK